MELHSSIFLIKVKFTCSIILVSGVQHRDFPDVTVVKKKTHLLMQETQEMWVRSLGQGYLLEEKMATRSSILAEKSHGQRSLAGYRPWGYKASGAAEHTHLGNITFDICKYCEIITIIRIS